MLPAWLAVRSLYSLQKPMMLMPCWPSAGPTGCAGVALPACICNLMTARTFFATNLLLRGHRARRAPFASQSPPSHDEGRQPADAEQRPTNLIVYPTWRVPAIQLDLFDLEEVELDRRLAAKERDEHRHLVALRQHLA